MRNSIKTIFALISLVVSSNAGSAFAIREVQPPASGRGSGLHKGEIVLQTLDGKYFAFQSVAEFEKYVQDNGFEIKPVHEGATLQQLLEWSSFVSSLVKVTGQKPPVVPPTPPAPPAPPAPTPGDINVDVSPEIKNEATNVAESMIENSGNSNVDIGDLTNQLAIHLVNEFEGKISNDVAMEVAAEAISNQVQYQQAISESESKASADNAANNSNNFEHNSVVVPGLPAINIEAANPGTCSSVFKIHGVETRVDLGFATEAGRQFAVGATVYEDGGSIQFSSGKGSSSEGITREDCVGAVAPVLDAQRGMNQAVQNATSLADYLGHPTAPQTVVNNSSAANSAAKAGAQIQGGRTRTNPGQFGQ